MEDRKKKLVNRKSVIAIEPTQDGVLRCRFDLFVCLYPNVSSPFRGNVTTWTFRGDKWTDFEPAMIRKLLRYIIRKRNLYQLMILYDNTHPKSSPLREVLKINNQVVEKNRLYDYRDMLVDEPLPDYLR